MLNTRYPIFAALFTVIASSGTNANDTLPRGVLDQPLYPGAGNSEVIQPTGPELAQIMVEREEALVAEENQLRNLSRQQLQQRAENGERAAQLILAEDFADEANNESFTVSAANDALGDAAYWYSLAARRGFPGAPAADTAFPVAPLRAVRDQP